MEGCQSETTAKQAIVAYTTESEDMGAVWGDRVFGIIMEIYGIGRWRDAKV